MNTPHKVSLLIHDSKRFCDELMYGDLTRGIPSYFSHRIGPIINIVNFYNLYFEITTIAKARIQNQKSILTVNQIEKYTNFFYKTCPCIVFSAYSIRDSFPYYKHKNLLNIFSMFETVKKNDLSIDIPKSIDKFYTYALNHNVDKSIMRYFRQYQKNLKSILEFVDKVHLSNDQICTFYELNLSTIIQRNYIYRFPSDNTIYLDETKPLDIGEELFSIHFKEFKKKLWKYKIQYLYFIRHTEKKGFFIHLLVFNPENIQSTIGSIWKEASNNQGSIDCKYDFSSKDQIEEIIKTSLQLNLCVPLQLDRYKKLFGKSLTN